LGPRGIAQDGEQEGYIVVRQFDRYRRATLFLAGHSVSNWISQESVQILNLAILPEIVRELQAYNLQVRWKLTQNLLLNLLASLPCSIGQTYTRLRFAADRKTRVRRAPQEGEEHA
jgi:hypothetical protein